jgi:hypothetical protein
LDESAHYAGHLRDSIMAMCLKAALQRAMPQVDLLAFRLYRDKLLVDCGDPSDPIEIILVEQVAMAHLITGHLQAKGAHASSIEEVGVYLAAAARLAGELRRTALALQVFRATSRQLGRGADASPAISGKSTLEVESVTTEKSPSSEKETTSRSGHRDGPDLLPLRRSVSG